MSANEVRVVVVDDFIEAAETLAQLLEMDGYNVVTAGDAAHAMDAIERHQPHCVLLDVSMPNIDGRDLTRSLRSRYGDDIVLIAVTGHARDSELVMETFALVDHYLMKPVDLKELHAVLPPI